MERKCGGTSVGSRTSKNAEYKEELTLFLQDERSHEAAKKAFADSKKERGKFMTQHETALADYFTFFPKSRRLEVEARDEFKETSTLYRAVQIMDSIYMAADAQGLRAYAWFKRSSNIRVSEREKVTPIYLNVNHFTIFHLKKGYP